MLDSLQKKLSTLFVKPILSRYLKKERITHYKGFKLLVKPGVFHPRFFFSTGYLFDFLNTLNLGGKKFMELGCGSGIISLLARKKNAHVTCVDINETAVLCTLINANKNSIPLNSQLRCIQSNLFEKITKEVFDVIVVNPPYFFKDVVHEQQYAWNAGENGEYFERLFAGVKDYLDAHTDFYMILADNCDLVRIRKIAAKHQLSLVLLEKKKIRWETNYIFKIS
jgi:release factor glutamine methyltransferase